MSRNQCQCEAQIHKLINNCISCGRIVCSVEGEGPCLFCGNPIMKKGDIVIDDSQFPDMESKTAYSKALMHKDKLLDFHRRDVHQSNIIDDQADYYQIVDDVWQNEDIRSQAVIKLMQQADAEQTINTKQVFDYQTMQFKLEKECDAKQADEFRDEAKQLLKEADLAQKKKNQANSKTQHLADNQEYQKLYNEIITNLNNETKKETKKQNNKNNKMNQNNQQFKPTTCGVQFTDEYFQDFQKELLKVVNQEQQQDMFDEQFFKVEDGIGCLSMHQPWAQLVVEGFKRIEGRMWGTNYKGPLWIHAGAKQPETELISAIEHQYSQLYGNLNNVPPFPARYPTGVLIGVVDMVGYVRAAEYNKIVPKEQQEEGDTEFKFVFRNPRKLLIPIQMRGSNNIFKLGDDILKIAIKQLEKVPVKWGPYLVDPKDVAKEAIGEKQVDDTMSKIQEQFVINNINEIQDKSANESQKFESQIVQDESSIINQSQQAEKRYQQVQSIDSSFEKQLEWGILIKDVLKRDQLVRMANFLSTKIKKQNNQKGPLKLSFTAKNQLPCHDNITSSISNITGNENQYDNCTVHFLKLADKKVTIQNATALIVIGQTMEFTHNNQLIQLQQGKVFLVEEGYTLNGQFSGSQQEESVLKDISQDYVFKTWLIQLQQ
ncbi:unnamed protein product (macronuclear) [Paramecium tetraurelia]|uniref:ASCH domain-containing protein n=1 Tax=Paramecium tetraurelia TaxID=5888 RepID=A0E8J4_PARTE|nr:uncharacterized protein GSPATT00024340001 [Paramecium tetraurelia]CAK91611.1 unnamed protein product [Paramecium tetraurelia]|eukprot:XP_001459008.1 hypothetical protein (macronuclear) [Paramecium tetraurelia strain d4-2]